MFGGAGGAGTARYGPVRPRDPRPVPHAPPGSGDRGSTGARSAPASSGNDPGGRGLRRSGPYSPLSRLSPPPSPSTPQTPHFVLLLEPQARKDHQTPRCPELFGFIATITYHTHFLWGRISIQYNSLSRQFLMISLWSTRWFFYVFRSEGEELFSMLPTYLQTSLV